MRLAGWLTSGGAAPGGRASARNLSKYTGQGLLIAAASACIFWLVWIYGNSLRDPQYLNGWLLASGMSLQVYFHMAIKSGTMAPKSAKRWRRIHIFVGYALVAAFLSHTDFSMPDTGFEWALWTGFTSVTISGIFGVYLGWSLKGKRWIDEVVTYDRIPARIRELAREVQNTVARSDPSAAAIALPALPHDAWIMDLYANHVRDFIHEQRNYAAHLVGSQRPIKKVIEEIDNLSQFVDNQGQEKLDIIKDLVIEKDRLDFARLFLGLNKAWLLVHVPVTYSLTVLVVLHVIVVYAFSSGI